MQQVANSPSVSLAPNPTGAGAPQLPVTQASTSPQSTPTNTSSPTVITGANISDKVIPQNQTTLNNALTSNPLTAGSVTGGTKSATSTSEGGNGVVGGTYVATPSTSTDIQNNREAGGTYTGDDGNVYYNYDSTPVAGTAGAMIPHTTIPSTGDAGTDSVISRMEQLKTQMDASSAALMSNISAQYQQLISQQQDANTRQQASVSQTLLMGGSSRYAQISSAGILNTQISYGISQIATLQNDENSKLIAAQQAQQAGDQKTLDSELTVYNSIRTEKAAAQQKLQDALTAQNQKLQDQNIAANRDTEIMKLFSAGTTDPTTIASTLNSNQDFVNAYGGVTAADITSAINNLNPNASAVATIMTDAAKNGATQDVLAAIGKATNVTDAIKLAGQFMQDPTSPAGQYTAYIQSAQAQGKTPVDYQTYSATQDYLKAFNTAKGTEAGKLSGDTTSGNGATTTGGQPLTSTNVQSKSDIPTTIRPYSRQSANGTWYVDLSAVSSTQRAALVAQAGDLPVVSDKNQANDLVNITDANKKLQTIATIMKDLNNPSALARDLGGAGLTQFSSLAQTNPTAAASGALNDSALDILKAMSGVQGFRGNASVIANIKENMPTMTDTQDVAAHKLSFVAQQIADRESSILGTPGTVDNTNFVIRSEDQAQQALTNAGKQNPDTATQITKILGETNPNTGQPYTYLDASQILGIDIPATGGGGSSGGPSISGLLKYMFTGSI